MPSNIITICSTSETCVVSAVAGLIFAQLRSTIHRIDKFSPWTQSKLTWLGRMSRELGMVWCAGPALMENLRHVETLFEKQASQ